MWDVDWSAGSYIMIEGREAVGEFITVVNWLADVRARLDRAK
jgi:hypothetical protein